MGYVSQLRFRVSNPANGPDRMDVCFVRLGGIANAAADKVDFLTTEEEQRSRRFARSEDRLRFIVGRRLSLQIVSDLTGCRPSDVAVRTKCMRCGTDRHGKPFAVHPGGILKLSIAHSGAHVLVAVTFAREVGVDIEMIDRSRFDTGILTQIESAHEQGHTPREAAAFTRLWVHKEAVLKCTGAGLYLSPRMFSVDFSASRPVVLDPSGCFAMPISLAGLPIADGYAAAVALSGESPFTIEKI